MSGMDYRNGLIKQYASDYGITISDDVASALTTAIGSQNQEGVIKGEVGAYANAINELNIATANDPLTKMLATEQALYTSSGDAAKGYADQLTSIYNQAPQLFGSLTPDQIKDYLKPLQSQFDTERQTVEGAAAARGNTGSSLEATALAQTDQQFNQNVTQQGLLIGQQQQQNQAAILQQLYTQYLQQQSQALSAQQQTSGQISQNQYQVAQFKAQLPLLLNAYATQSQQLQNATNGSKTPWGAIASTGGAVIGGVAGGIYGGPTGAAAGASAGSAVGGGIAGAFTGDAQGPNTAGSLINTATLLGSTFGKNNSLPPTYGQQPTSSSANSPATTLNWSTQPGLLLGKSPTQ